MASLLLKAIHKTWGKTVGVNNVNLDIADEEFIVILGPSGCGKTTTMRMIAGLEDPTSGDIEIDGKRVNDLEPKDRDIAMVFQNYGLYPQLSVYENIRFPLKVRGVEKDTQDARVKKAAEMVELGNLLDRKPKELSGGQRQRVALARAIVREPKVFLMDEPLSNLDAKLRVSTRAQLKNLQHELKVTTIYVTHDQIEAMTLADRVVVMCEGKIQQVATPTELYNKPQNIFVAGFIGTPPMNIIRGELSNHSFIASGTQVSASQQTFSGDCYLGFRAEDARITEDASQGHIQAAIYSIELLGDVTLVNVKVDDTLISVKTHKEYRNNIGETIGITIPEAVSHYFDCEDGMRLSP